MATADKSNDVNPTSNEEKAFINRPFSDLKRILEEKHKQSKSRLGWQNQRGVDYVRK